MIVLILKDGLGNQLFQYAAARCLAEKLGVKLKLDIRSYRYNNLRRYSLNNFSIEQNLISDFEYLVMRIKRKFYQIAKISKKNYDFKQREHHYDDTLFIQQDGVCIEGYWQSEKYFLSIEDKIRQEFVVKSEPGKLNQEILEQINKVNAVSLHVRRGDYISDPHTNALHGVCSLLYYNEAISCIKERVSDPHFFIFSDDMEWVKNNLVIENSPVQYVDHNAEKDYEDLRLMYSCKHNITANSSFSWWGAWLNSNKNKIVIAPKNWVQGQYYNPDLLPSSWIQLEG